MRCCSRRSIRACRASCAACCKTGRVKAMKYKNGLPQGRPFLYSGIKENQTTYVISLRGARSLASTAFQSLTNVRAKAGQTNEQC